MRQLWMKRATNVHVRVTLAERVLTFLEQRYEFVGVAEKAAREICCSTATIRKLFERRSAPSLALFGRMGAVYGSEFLHAVFDWDWLDPVKADAENARIERQIAELRERQRQLGAL